jgi:magnesium chelatase family protein
LVDRIDMHITLPPVDLIAVPNPAEREPSSVIRERVAAARAIQRQRFLKGITQRSLNSALTARDLEAVCELEADGVRVLVKAIDKLGLSARAHGKVLKLARTIADLEGEAKIRAVHIGEAISARLLDRQASLSQSAA